MRMLLYIAFMTVFMFFVQAAVPGVTELLSLTPALALNGMPWQFVTYMFMHGGVMHVTFNMFALLIFGPRVEEITGKYKFLLLYFASGIFSGLFYLLLSGPASTAMMLGASGAVYAVLAAFAVLYPRDWIMIYFVPLPAAAVLVLLVVAESVFGIFSLQPGIANWGHVGGLICGALMMLYWKHKRKSEREEMLDYVIRIN
ncbi:MAG: rhomboid family intramembrane serine protease [Candidatus Micrarchaeota archaeon]|nr:rhomboid family intramembrane serine protease [Candidatus Micrarchaeota archaeon]